MVVEVAALPERAFRQRKRWALSTWRALALALTTQHFCCRLDSFLQESFKPGTKLFVDRLTRNVNESHLKEIFGHYGSVVAVDLATDKETNLPLVSPASLLKHSRVDPMALASMLFDLMQGHAHVTFEHEKDAQQAQVYMDGVSLVAAATWQCSLTPPWLHIAGSA